MAIALDTSATLFNGTTSATTTTVSYTVTGSDPVLFVGIIVTFSTSDWVTSVTYGGVAMTRVAKVGTNYLYVLSAPPTGANDVVLTCGAAFLGVAMAAVSYTGAATFTGAALDASTTKTDTSTNTSTVSLSTVANNCWTLISSVSEFTTAMAAGSGTTQRQLNPISTFSMIVGDSNAAITPAGSTSMTVTSSGSDTLDSIMVSFAPVSGGGGGGGGGETTTIFRGFVC